MRLISFLTVLIAFTGCAIISNNDSEPEAAADAYYFLTCGPADGPGFEIIIPTDPAVTCDSVQSLLYNQPWDQSFTRLYIYYYSESDTLTTFRFGTEVNTNATQSGWAGRCEKGETDCLEAHSGTIRFLNERRGFFNARVDILFEDESRFNAHLQLKECPRERPLLCG